MTGGDWRAAGRAGLPVLASRRRAACRTTCSAWPGTCCEQGHQPHVLAPGTGLAAPAARNDRTERFTSAGTAVAVRYNGSVARVNFGPLSAARVRRWLRAGRFDLLHIHEPITPSIALLALWAADVPVVATFHTATPRSRIDAAGRRSAARRDREDRRRHRGLRVGPARSWCSTSAGMPW